MATAHLTAPARAGERARSLKSQIGPVTAAIRTMRKAERIDDAVQALAALRQRDPAIDSIPALRDLRRAIADRIEADLALLDALCGDADIEQDAGEMPESETFNRNLDDEPSLGSLCGTAASLSLSQHRWGGDFANDCEAQPEDDNDVSAPERAGKGFVRCGADDAEDGHDAEGLTDDNGIVNASGAGEQGFTAYGRYA